METTPLKSFATKARTDLIKEVGARVTVVLAENSLARVESAAAVRALEDAMTRDGREQVIDRVAYTWFNRIIALRFMDANGYTPSGVVSPEAGRTTGQPEVLAEAKAGTFDHAVVPARTQETITALLNGTRPSQDAQGEAYGLLLEAYSRSWHKAMPFMFEREGDYTELLIPTALLAAGSVRDRAVKTLAAEVCSEVEVIGWLYQFYISDRKDEVFAGFKKNKKAGAAEIPAATQLFTPHWIVRYLVENSIGRLWLLNNPSSRLVEQMDYYIKPVDDDAEFLRITKPEELKVIDPAVGSGHMLTYTFDLLFAIYTEKGYDPAEIPGLILKHNLYGTEIDPRAGSLAAFALTMKAAAKRKLFLKSPVQPNIRVLENVHFDPAELDYLWSVTNGNGFARGEADEFWNAFEHADTFGSLIQPKEPLISSLEKLSEGNDAGGDILHSEVLRKASAVVEQSKFLSRRYVLAIANPPYMGSGNMESRLSEWAKGTYPRSKSDLFAMFIDRCADLVLPAGMTAMITMHAWMFLGSYEALREHLLASSRITALAHLGAGAFDSIGGEVVATVAFVRATGAQEDLGGVFIRLTDETKEANKSAALQEAAQGSDRLIFTSTARDLARVPSSPIAYWLSDAMRQIFEIGRLGDALDVKKGLDTGNNARFLRGWHEVSRSSIALGRISGHDAAETGATWFPFNKGGERRRWYGNQEFVIQWRDNGAEIRSMVNAGARGNATIRNSDFYFKPSAGWTMITTSEFSARAYPPGFLFGSGGGGIFGSPDDLYGALSALNSVVMSRAVNKLSPTINFDPGPVSRFPFARRIASPDLIKVSRQLVDVHHRDWNRAETSWEFEAPEIAGGASDIRLEDRARAISAGWFQELHSVRALEELNNKLCLAAYGVEEEIDSSVELDELTLRIAPGTARGAESAGTYFESVRFRIVQDLVSWAVGCMFGRYSLDRPGLILANQGSTLQDFLTQVPSPSFLPDKDNVIPIVGGDWFEDDIVARFRKFLRTAFGDETFEENFHFVTESLGVKDIREYFVNSFYDDHVRRYTPGTRKSPIYWLFASPKGSFSALIYLHRYTPSTVSTVLTGYLREFIGKLEANLGHQLTLAAGMGGASAAEIANALKESDRIRRVLVELRDYEHDTLFPLAGKQISLDLDDGVVVNYQKLGTALKDIGLKKGGGDE